MDYDIKENILYVFTDWASRSVFSERFNKKTGRFWGKWILIVYYDKNLNLVEENESDNISYIGATNNDMELEACVDALKIVCYRDLEDFIKVVIVTDSQFVKEWAYRAERVRPKTKRSWITWEPIKHVEQRKQLIKYKRKIYEKQKKWVEFDWVKAHDGNEFNEKADESAVKWARSEIRMSWTKTIPRSKFLKSKPGRFDMAWQKVLIHIIWTTWFKQQKINKYKYEVVSRDNPYFKLTNDAYYEGYLSAKKIYKVEFGKDDKTRFIVDVISEEEKEDIRKKMIAAGVSIDVFYGKVKHEE